MANNWPLKSLSELMDIQGGAQPPASTFKDELLPGYIRFVQIRDFETDAHLTFIKDEPKWRHCSEDDVLIARYGASVGRICRGVAGAYNVALAKTVPTEKATLKFLYHLLRSDFFQVPLAAMSGRSAQAGFNKGDLSVIEVPHPPLAAQHAIAHILGTLDDKIELNRKQNETLEAMARALFKAWFVDFEPVHAKIENRWQRGLSLPGLPAQLYDLFPDRLVESELGEIPEGWQTASISEYSSLNPESWTKRTRPGEIRYVDLSNTKWGRVESVTYYSTDDAPSRAQRVLRPLDTIVGTVRPGNGSYALIADEGLTGSTGFAVLRPLRRECSELVYLAATAHENIERLSNLADGGAYPAVRPEIVSATQVPRVSGELINEFSRQVSPMLAGIADNERTSRSLAQLRDTLLPKLISGELRVPDAEQLLGEKALA